MKKIIIAILGVLFLAGCNLEVRLASFSNSDLINLSTNFCNNINGNITIYNNTAELLYLECLKGDIVTELYHNNRSYIERHNISKSHEVVDLIGR